MNKYEIMFIVKATIEADQVKKVADELIGALKSNKAKIVEEKQLGQKQFAYPIKKEITGFYFLLNVEADAKAITAFEHKSAINENVLRHLIIKLDME